MHCLSALMVAAVMFGGAIFSTSEVQANLINGDFETGDFTGWTVGGPNGGSGVALDGTLITGAVSPFPPNRVNVRSGDFAAFGLTASTAGEFLSLSQTVNLLPGEQTAGFYMSLDANSMMGIHQAIGLQQLAIFVNGSYQPFTTRFPQNNFPTGSTPADFYEFSSEFTSVGGPTLLEFRISGSGTSRAGISVDDAFVTGTQTIIPEPSTFIVWSLLGGLGIIGWWRRRR
jgi:hypothetical protein